MEASINALNIEARDDGMIKEYNYGDRKYYTVNNVVGMTTKEAVANLKEYKVEFSGSGSKVLYQSPKAGTVLYEGETIRLMLGDE